VSAEVDDPTAPDFVRGRHMVFEMGELLRYVIFRERLWGLHHPEEAAESESQDGGEEQTPEPVASAEVADVVPEATLVSESAAPQVEAPHTAEGGKS
jgi:hypothetical protein